MKLVVQLQLVPDDSQDVKLREVIEAFNAAADYVAGVAFKNHTANVFELRKICYAAVREVFGLSSQMAQLAIKAARDAYYLNKRVCPKFRKHAAISYDARTMSFKGLDRVSLLTRSGRVVVPFLVGSYQRERMLLPKGQSKLLLRKDGKWFLLVTVDIPGQPQVPVTDFLGVDLGIANIATDSDPDSEPLSGKIVEAVRRKHNLQRQRLQRKGTKGAKKKLVRINRKESRFRKHINHVISKCIVEQAKRTKRGIALENLKHIRAKITARGAEARNRLSGWGFAQLASFVAYKAVLAGVVVVYVDPRNTSRTCAECGYCDKSNRKSQSEFLCKSCGHTAHADKNAARNIRALGTATYPQNWTGLTA